MKATSSYRLAPLDGLRGFLAVWVMFAHIGYFIGLSKVNASDYTFPGAAAKIIVALSSHAWDGVNVFMILSGFVISHLIDQKSEAYLPFLTRRFFRLFPVFAIAMLVGFATNNIYVHVLQENPWSHNVWLQGQLAIAMKAQSAPLAYLAVDAFMLQGIVPAFVLPMAGSVFSSLAWCISTEWQFYIVAPFCYQAMKRSPMVLAIVTACVLFWLSWPDMLFPTVNPNWSFLPLQFHWFYLGIISYLFYRRVREGEQGNAVLGLGALVLVFVSGVLRKENGFAGIVWLVVVTLLVEPMLGRVSQTGERCRGCLQSRFMRYLGRISYPVYLIHWPVTIVLVSLLMVSPPTWQVTYAILCIAVPAITLPVAHLIHMTIEQPLMDFGRRLAERMAVSKAHGLSAVAVPDVPVEPAMAVP